MRKASELAEGEPQRSVSASGRKTSTPYHLRYVDPSNIDPPVNDDENSDFDDDLDDDVSADETDSRASLAAKPNAAVDDLLTTPRYVDPKALKRSTQAEIERIERERHGDHFASYAHGAPPEPPNRNALVWTLVSTCMAIAIAAVTALVMYSEEVGRAGASVKTALFGPEERAEIAATNTPPNATSVIQKPAAQSPAAPAPVAQPQQQPAAPVAPQSQAAAQQQANLQPPINETSPLAKSLFELGALSCIARANQISKFLSNGSEAVVLQKPIGNPDKSLLMATMLPTTADKKQDFSIVTLSPNPTSGCDGNYQSIRVIEKPCPNALAEMYGAAKALTAGTSGISIVPLNQFGRVFAIPAGNTCVMIKQELVQ